MKKLIFFTVAACALAFFTIGCIDIDENEKITRPKFHTQSNEGIWIDKSDTHLPVVTFTGKDTIDVRVPLKPTKQPFHYIEVIFLMDGDREIASKTISFSYDEPRARFKLPNIEKGNYKVVAKCNLHDMWMTQVVVPARAANPAR
jgi:desulfoferrodoxin (superoxide reductase-like protein)